MTKLQAVRRLVAGPVLVIAVSGLVPAGAAAAPAPCGGVPQISDATGDGHHSNTDVTSAWLAESAGHVQAVVKVHIAVWEPVHDDSDAAGFALLWTSGGVTRYVRAEAPRGAPVRFDHGTWTLAGGFASAGPTTGATTTGTGGTVTIDVPDAVAPPGTVLARPFVLTYDGMTGPDVHWVDRAPGGVTPTSDEVGADVVVGACSPGGPGTPGAPGSPGSAGGEVTGPVAGTPGAGGVRTTAVVLQAPSTIRGGGPVRVSGRVVPARAGVTVTLTSVPGRTRTRTAVTGADGRFAFSVPVLETTRLRAVADGLGSQTLTVTVRSLVAFTSRQLKDGRTLVSGTVRPALPGRVLLLRWDAITPSAKTSARGGRFRLLLRRPVPGRYQAVFIPSGARAERSTSKTGVIR